MDPELQGDQNKEYKPSYDVEVTRDEAPELRETHQDFSQLAKEEAQIEKEDMDVGGKSFGKDSASTDEQHLTQSGEPDRRFKDNQSDQTSYQRDNQSYDRNNQGNSNDQQAEHLTKAGEPDMRFKENREAIGQS